jgi:Spy/CpxP family protein refolding chaperone
MKSSVLAWSAAALMLASAPQLGAQSFAWWKSEQFQKEVGLTSDQSARIDAIFQATFPKLKDSRTELDKLEAELSQMISDNVDEKLVVQQIDRVEATRAAASKMRTLMLLHERQVLTPAQRVKFKAAYEQWEKDHPRPSREAAAPAKK